MSISPEFQAWLHSNRSTLSFTDVADAGLEVIGQLPKLKFLNIAETKVTAHAIAELQEERPDLKIIVVARRTQR